MWEEQRGEGLKRADWEEGVGFEGGEDEGWWCLYISGAVVVS